MKRITLWFLPLLFLSAALAGPLRAETFTGKVVKVIDGDTLAVLRDGKEVRVLLNGIDAPEPGQPYGDNATKHLKGLTDGKDIKITVKETDRFKRLAADVSLLDGRSLNQEMVKAGLAWWSDKYAPNDKKLEALQTGAKSQKVGLWAGDKPIAPWLWRRDHRPARKSSAPTP